MIRSEDEREDYETNPYSSFRNERGVLETIRARPRRSIIARLLQSAGEGAVSFVAMYGLYTGVYLATGASWTDEAPWMAGVAASAVGIATLQAGILYAASNGAIRWMICWIVSGGSVPVAVVAGVFVANWFFPQRMRYELPNPAVWITFVIAALSAQAMIGACLTLTFRYLSTLRRNAELSSSIEQ